MVLALGSCAAEGERLVDLGPAKLLGSMPHDRDLSGVVIVAGRLLLASDEGGQIEVDQIVDRAGM